ncbi:MAG: hypothetical protein EAZ97_05260 [Bacteroidetes bacterium]|nr:MAG: hypothetical protein EAZ97_05260 [Bacteroidota bacterium]
MKNKKILTGIIALQVVMLCGMFFSFFYPILVGKEIKLKVRGYDPRDIFRGDYVNLAYDFSDINLDSIKHDVKKGENFVYGDVFYVELTADEKGYHAPVGIWKEKPSNGNMFVKTVTQSFYNSNYEDSIGVHGQLSLKAGIESYFASPEKAQEIEKILQNNDTTVVIESYIFAKVADNGVVRITNVDYKKLKK